MRMVVCQGRYPHTGRGVHNRVKRLYICPRVEVQVSHSASVTLGRELCNVGMCQRPEQGSSEPLQHVGIDIFINTSVELERPVHRTKESIHGLPFQRYSRRFRPSDEVATLSHRHSLEGSRDQELQVCSYNLVC